MASSRKQLISQNRIDYNFLLKKVDQIKIALKDINDVPVRLNGMSAEALDSFVSVVAAIKQLSLAVEDREKLTFSIRDGSALCSLQSTDKSSIFNIYQEMDTAISGQSLNKSITDPLRKVQDQIKRESYNWSVVYEGGYQKHIEKIDLTQKLKNSKRVAVKRKRGQFEFRILIKTGFLNQVGGNTPNYHFDYGSGDSITVGCSKEEARAVNQFLYKNMTCLLLCKQWYREDRRDEYFHKAIVRESFASRFKKFLNEYYQHSELIERLTRLHQFAEIELPKDSGKDILLILLAAFNDHNLHLSELKTLLLISKPFIHDKTILERRNYLLDTYLKKKSTA